MCLIIWALYKSTTKILTNRSHVNVQKHKNKNMVRRMGFIKNSTKQRCAQSLKPGFYDLTSVLILQR